MLKGYISIIMSTCDPLQERTQKALRHLARSTVPYELILLNRNHEWTTGTVINQGIAASVGEYVAFLCDDCFIAPNALELLKETLQDPAVGVAGALLRYPNGIVQHAGGSLRISRENKPSSNGHPAKLLLGVDLKHIGQHESMRNFETQDADFVTGAFMMTRRDVLETIGWYATECELTWGDVDFCLRAREAGYRIRFVAPARGIHLEGSTRGSRGGALDWFIDRWGTSPLVSYDDVVAVGGSNG